MRQVRVTKLQAMALLQRALDEIPELEYQSLGTAEFTKWHRDTVTAIRYIFGKGSPETRNFISIRYGPKMTSLAWSPQECEEVEYKYYIRGLQQSTGVLQSMCSQIENYFEDGDISDVEDEKIPNTNEIFIVHGRDEGTKNTVARFLEKLGLKPVILSEQASKGRTIIEKFKDHAQVGFAVVLLTPDDVGALQGEEDKADPRPRQNVIFEMGFFVGRLGQERVCTLAKGDVKILSDYAGVLYIPFDSDGWKNELIRELQAAGFEVDANKVL